jgi:catechol 2,3-dioxygenase-like lactoylglutathione lyase family enzyme
MVTGAHVIIYSGDPEADRAFFRDVLEFPNVDVGEGWLIFALPPTELAVHPAEASGVHELYFICEDLETFMREMEKRKIRCEAPQTQTWGLLTRLSLPGGGKIGIYQPRHARP